jgi:hypothetical protein
VSGNVRRSGLLAVLVLAAFFPALAVSPPAADEDAVDRILRACEDKELVTKVIEVRFKPLGEAALLVDQLLGPCGSYSVPKTLRLITVEDEPQIVERVGQALASWDVPPRSAEVTISLILALREPSEGLGIRDEIRDVSETLSQLTRYTSFERLGSATVKVIDGAAAEADLGDRYRVSFRVGGIDAERGIVHLEPFDLLQLPAPNETGARLPQARRLLGTALNLPQGRLHLIGAPARDRDRAIFLALEVWADDPAPPAGTE